MESKVFWENGTIFFVCTSLRKDQVIMFEG